MNACRECDVDFFDVENRYSKIRPRRIAVGCDPHDGNATYYVEIAPRGVLLVWTARPESESSHDASKLLFVFPKCEYWVATLKDDVHAVLVHPLPHLYILFYDHYEYAFQTGVPEEALEFVVVDSADGGEPRFLLSTPNYVIHCEYMVRAPAERLAHLELPMDKARWMEEHFERDDDVAYVHFNCSFGPDVRTLRCWRYPELRDEMRRHRVVTLDDYAQLPKDYSPGFNADGKIDKPVARYE